MKSATTRRPRRTATITGSSAERFLGWASAIAVCAVTCAVTVAIGSGTARAQSAPTTGTMVTPTAPTAPRAPSGSAGLPPAKMINGVWEIDAAPFGLPGAETIAIKAELEYLGDGVVDVRSWWQGIPINATGRLRGTVLTVRVDAPRIANGVVVAYLDGNVVSGTADGTYPLGRNRGAGKGTFSGRRAGTDVGKTGFAGADRLSDALKRVAGATFIGPDTLESGAIAVIAMIGACAFALTARIARMGLTGRAVVAEGLRPHTRVVKGKIAAGHLAYYEYLSINLDGRCEVTEKLRRFDPSVPGAEDGIRGVRFRTVEQGGRTYVSVHDLVVIAEIV